MTSTDLFNLFKEPCVMVRFHTKAYNLYLTRRHVGEFKTTNCFLLTTRTLVSILAPPFRYQIVTCR